MGTILDEIIRNKVRGDDHEFISSLFRRRTSSAPKCKYVITKPTLKPAIGFEFDMSYGSSTSTTPPEGPDYSMEGKKITHHKKTVHGFRLKGDGNRIEIGTIPFELNAAGKAELEKTMDKIIALTDELNKRCGNKKPDKSLNYNSKTGAPIYFDPPLKRSKVGCVFPLSFYPKKGSYYSNTCRIGASPQATLTLPLSNIDKLASIIKRSELTHKYAPGYALSGPVKSKSGRYLRQGVRSQALYDAQTVVNKSRRYHIRKKTKLPDGTVINNSNYSNTLQGFLILMVCYLKTSLKKYYSSRDYEAFAKSYLPLNVKNPFRLLYKDLTADEKKVFKGLYYNSSEKRIWKLAYSKADSSFENKQLFPPKVKSHQEFWFTTAPTWGEFVEKTTKNIPLKREVDNFRGKDKGELVGCEVLWAPLSKIIPHEPGSRRVTVEMRRLGFDWVRTERWKGMTRRLFKIAKELN